MNYYDTGWRGVFEFWALLLIGMVCAVFIAILPSRYFILMAIIVMVAVVGLVSFVIYRGHLL